MQRDGVFQYVSSGLQLLFPIFRGTTLKGETTNLSFVEKVAKHTNSDRSKVVNDLIRTDRQIAEIIK
ncbi:MAG: hypothetical protein CL923_06255 [Deltaproteobacteria bacterium]|nr:hypothetical protein [Deltaproteobacteria bacterium]